MLKALNRYVKLEITMDNGIFIGKADRRFHIDKKDGIGIKNQISKGKITQELIDLHGTWQHSGFNVFCCERIQPGDEEVMENLGRYIVRAFFLQERMI